MVGKYVQVKVRLFRIYLKTVEALLKNILRNVICGWMSWKQYKCDKKSEKVLLTSETLVSAWKALTLYVVQNKRYGKWLNSFMVLFASTKPSYCLIELCVRSFMSNYINNNRHPDDTDVFTCSSLSIMF